MADTYPARKVFLKLCAPDDVKVRRIHTIVLVVHGLHLRLTEACVFDYSLCGNLQDKNPHQHDQQIIDYVIRWACYVYNLPFIIVFVREVAQSAFCGGVSLCLG